MHHNYQLRIQVKFKFSDLVYSSLISIVDDEDDIDDDDGPDTMGDDDDDEEEIGGYDDSRDIGIQMVRFVDFRQYLFIALFAEGKE